MVDFPLLGLKFKPRCTLFASNSTFGKLSSDSTTRKQSVGESPGPKEGRQSVRHGTVAGSRVEVEAACTAVDVAEAMFVLLFEFHTCSFFKMTAAFAPRDSLTAFGRESLSL